MINKAYTGFRDDILKFIPSDAKSILDVGCSNGNLGENIKKNFKCKVTGIEINEKAAKEAIGKLDEVITADIGKYNFETYKNKFDCIIFADVLEHIPNPQIVLKKSLVSLKKEGSIIISLPNIQHYTAIVNLFRGQWPQRSRGLFDKTHLKFFIFRNITELVNVSGLKIIELDRSYRFIDRAHSYNKYAKYMSIFGLKNFFTYQYVFVSKVD